ncbi:lysostaphin resistance A-like protein [Flavobacterium sp.]|uniref:CPBP family intramembrane glutamic endopeptidase n=1 Tax=Flavobacterium sp. TaxID=239 RepID=UPI003D13112B
MLTKIFLNPEKKLREGWWVVIFFIILTTFLFPLILLANKYSFEIKLEYQTLLILIVSIICQKLKRDTISNLIGKISTKWLNELFKGIFIGACLMILPALTLTLTGFISWQISAISYTTLISGLTLFSTVAIAEELLFRGFLFQRLHASIGKWPTQLIISGLFLLTHLNNPGMVGIVKTFASINIFIASLLFGFAYLKTKSLAMPIGLHFMANFTQGTLLGFGVSGSKDPSFLLANTNHLPVWITGGNFGIEASSVGLLFLIIITLSFNFKNLKSQRVSALTV